MNAEVFPLLKTRARPKERRARRVVDKKHLGYVGALGCCVCGAPGPSEIHHLRTSASTACAGRKSADSETVPMCVADHRGQRGVHQWPTGEDGFWEFHRIDGDALAARLWAESRNGGMP